MQINSLYIDDYKLLKNFTINFSKDVSILIGINGSGKSTILESIAQIFSDALLNRKSSFAFKINYDLFFSELIFGSPTTSLKDVSINVNLSSEKPEGGLAFKIKSKNTDLKEALTREHLFSKIEDIIPSNIVIYYSGLSEIMKQICQPHSDKLSEQYRENKQNARSSFFYFDPQYFNIILLSLLSYQYGDIPTFLLEKAKIDYLQSVQILLKRPNWARTQKITDWWGAKGEIKLFLDYLMDLGKPIVINETHDLNVNDTVGNVIIEGLQNESLTISILTQEMLFTIREHFVEEKKLFEVLNILYQDGFLQDIKFSFRNKDGDSMDTLSEGEQQTIIIRGLVELLSMENTLFLFDEPDTYLHPSWQRNFIESINDLSKNAEDNNSQFIITTHSPQLLSNADPANSDVQIMEDGEIVKVTPKYYGRDISTILYEMMGVERRNKKVAKLLSVLFNHIEDEELGKSKIEYEKLVAILGEDDPAIVRAKTQLDYLQEEQNEANC